MRAYGYTCDACGGFATVQDGHPNYAHRIPIPDGWRYISLVTSHGTMADLTYCGSCKPNVDQLMAAAEKAPRP